MLGGSIHRAAEQDDLAGAIAGVRFAWGAHGAGPCPYRDDEIARVANAMREVGDEWARVRPGHSLELAWPLPTTRHRGGAPRGRAARRGAGVRTGRGTRRAAIRG